MAFKLCANKIRFSKTRENTLGIQGGNRLLNRIQLLGAGLRLLHQPRSEGKPGMGCHRVTLEDGAFCIHV